jgi:hypothetical protein
MDSQLMEALAEILVDALLADLETEMEQEQVVTAGTAETPRGIGSRKDQDLLVAVSNLAPDAAQLSNPSDPIVART